MIVDLGSSATGKDKTVVYRLFKSTHILFITAEQVEDKNFPQDQSR